MRRYAALFIIIGLFVIFSQTPSYSFSINVSPPSIHLSTPPGGTDSGTITVENKSDSSIDMQAYVEDWVYNPDGSKKFLPPGSTPLSCAKWINIYPKKFHLEPKDRMGVQYTISIPEDAEGGHYTVIFFESIVGDDDAEGELMVRFAGRIGTIIYQETKGKVDKSASIVSFECGRPDQNKPLEAKVIFKNEGNTYIKAEGVMQIIDGKGNIFGRRGLGPINTLPGDTMEYSTEWLGQLEEGEYDVIATFDTGLDTPLIAETKIKIVSGGGIEKLVVDTTKTPPVFTVIINNTGNLNTGLEGKIDLVNESEEVVETISLRKTLVAPDSKKELKAEADKVLRPGRYKAKAVILFGGKELIKEEVFSVK